MGVVDGGPMKKFSRSHSVMATIRRIGGAYAKVYGALERRDIIALIPAKAEPVKLRVPLRRFRCDAKYDILKYPRGCI